MAEQATLRKLIALLGDDALDAPLVVDVRDGRGNTELIPVAMDIARLPFAGYVQLVVDLGQHKLHILPIKRSA